MRINDKAVKPELRSSLIKGLAGALGLLALLAVLPCMVADIGTPDCARCHEEIAEAAAASPHADTACTDCHDGATPVQRFAFRRTVMYGMRLGWLPVTEVASSISDATCENCHTRIEKQGITTSSGIRFQHATCSATHSCVTCHAGVGHPSATRWSSTYSMDLCLSCHKQAQANFSDGCDKCHVGRFNRLPNKVESSFAVVHGSNWQDTHALGDWNTCGACHTNEFCGRCHGALVPHDRRTIVGTHGRSAREPDNQCGGCHRNEAFCNDCHKIEMPHPQGFLPEHPQITAQMGQAVCDNCHLQVDCDACHAAHIHPGGAAR